MSTLMAERPTSQSLEALARAKKVRSHRSQALSDLSHNRRSLESALHDELLGSVQISVLLMAVPSRRVAVKKHTQRGVYATRTILQMCGLNPARTVRSLTDTSRERLLAAAEKVSGHRAWIREERRASALKPCVKQSNVDEQQRAAALEKANRTRTARKEAKERMESGEMDLAEALEYEALQSYKLGKLVRHLRRVSPDGTEYLTRLAPTAAARVLTANRISPLVTPAELSTDGKRLLVLLFADARFRKPERAEVECHA